ncbi:Xanthine-guanine phosphoribosyltransferase [Buchnera aphidicola (Eriosoma grossulariae)]|uniref:xanthine phosphoribosyltransferase n=1 Tax=Buchnera aphidicola TaxID=9 RepID=UPI003463BCC9
MTNKYIVTWDMIHIHAKKLARILISIKKWNRVIAVSRGGLVPAAILSRELGIRCVDTVCISSYDYKTIRDLKIIKIAEGDCNDTIIIDDLVDTGGTAKIIRKIYPNSYFVTIFAKPNSRLLVDKYIIDVPQNIWIELPWDMSINYVEPMIK